MRWPSAVIHHHLQGSDKGANLMAWREKPIVRRMLSQQKDPRVGYVQASDVFELAHFYHARDVADANFEHWFVYRNYTVESFAFTREISVQGPVQHQLRASASTLSVIARSDDRFFIEVQEDPVCATLLVSQPQGRPGQVLTAVTLLPIQPHKVPLSAPLPLKTTVAYTDRLDACCQKL